MTLRELRAKVVLERMRWVRQMVQSIESLPLDTMAAFTADSRTPAAAEPYLRRGLEALLDLGRHILAKALVME